MLSEIQKTEQEVREQIATAKQNAAVALQKAQADSAETLDRLEETLRLKEAEAVAKAASVAQAEADKMVAKAESSISNDIEARAAAIAREILSDYVK